MKPYTTPEIEIILLNEEDVIATSDCPPETGSL